VNSLQLSGDKGSA